jgi:hypothetical protein
MRVVDRHTENIRISSYLSKLPMIGREQKKDVVRVAPADLIPALQAAKVDFVLAGAHGIAGWLSEPRATQDVDFIIRVKDRKKAAEAILKVLKDAEVEQHPVVWRFKRNGQYVADLMFTNSPLFERVYKSEFVEKKIGRLTAKVPKLEACLAMKFASMIGHHRQDHKRYLDMADFVAMLNSNKKTEMTLLRELGELVYEGGGKEIAKMVEDVRAGRRLEL